MDSLTALPTVALFAGLLAVGFLIAAALSWFTARAVERDVRTRTSGSVTTVLGVVAALYAVLVAFVIVNEWSTVSDANSSLSDEAAALSAAHFDASALPEPDRRDIREALFAYGRSVVCDEIPRLADDPSPDPRTRAALERVFQAVADAEPTSNDSAFYTATVNQVTAVAAARRARVDVASTTVPTVLLVVIALSSLVLIGIASVLDTQHHRWHLALTAAVTVVVVLNLGLVISLARPFDGAASVSDAPLREGVPSSELVCDQPRG